MLQLKRSPHATTKTQHSQIIMLEVKRNKSDFQKRGRGGGKSRKATSRAEPQEWGQQKGATEDEMVGWHHRLNGWKLEQTPGD